MARWPVWASLLGVGILLVAPLAGSASAAYVAHEMTPPSATSSATFSYLRVTWNGQPISNAGQPSSAFSISKGQTAQLLIQVTETSGALVRNGTLSLTYLGIVLTTARAAFVPELAGPAAYEAWINWSFGPLYDALEGVFQFTAAMHYNNGSTAWSQAFYVFAKAPYLLASGAVVALLVLAIAELYWGVSAIREIRKAGGGAPLTASAGKPGTTPGSQASPDAAAGATTPGGPTPPPGGGSS